MTDQLDLVCSLVAEDEDIPGAGVMAQHMRHQSHEPVNPGPEVYGLRGHIDPHTSIDGDHARIAASTVRR